MKEIYLSALESFLLTLIKFDPDTRKKLEPLRLGEVNDFSDDGTYKATVEMTFDYQGLRHYRFVFEDRARVIGANILLVTKDDCVKIKINLLAVILVRFKYGRSGINFKKTEDGNLMQTKELTTEMLVEEVTKFINECKQDYGV